MDDRAKAAVAKGLEVLESKLNPSEMNLLMTLLELTYQYGVRHQIQEDINNVSSLFRCEAHPEARASAEYRDFDDRR